MLLSSSESWSCDPGADVAMVSGMCIGVWDGVVLGLSLGGSCVCVSCASCGVHVVVSLGVLFGTMVFMLRP